MEIWTQNNIILREFPDFHNFIIYINKRIRDEIRGGVNQKSIQRIGHEVTDVPSTFGLLTHISNLL